jgi:hypothetical protein
MTGEKIAPVIGRWALVRLCFGLSNPVADFAATWEWLLRSGAPVKGILWVNV